MPLILFHTRRVREALKAPHGVLADLFFLLLAAGLVGTLILVTGEASAKFSEKTAIDLSIWALPRYTLLSLCRGFAAYFLSLVFTLVYATVAAHHRLAERIMIPALDVLQSIPVLSFLPSVVLAMVALFPTRQIGLEIACIVMIFTGQAWNMTFSMFGSIKAIPAPLREAAVVYRMSAWRVFRLLELPASMIGLVWNSMMSMAGGWFVLTLSEAFTLHKRDFRLPGIGSYMGEAISAGDPQLFKPDAAGARHFDFHALASWLPCLAAVIAMIVMIVAVDQLFWRPIVAWSERFKMEETAEVDKPSSWLLNLLASSTLVRRMKTLLARRRTVVAAGNHPAPLRAAGASASAPIRAAAPGGKLFPPVIGAIGGWLALAALGAVALLGLWKLGRLLLELPLHNQPDGLDWLHVALGVGASTLRTSAAIAIGGLWTLPAGIAIGLSPKWSQRLQPVVQVVASFPANMLFPLITLLLVMIHFPFTIGCVALMLLGTQWYILFNVMAGAMAIPGDLKEVQTVFGAGWLKRWSRLYIPCVFPYFVTGLVTAAGGAWNATIVSEYVQVGPATFIAPGIGSLISQATDKGNYPLLAAATVSLAAIVVLINRFFWKKLYRIAEERYTLNL